MLYFSYVKFFNNHKRKMKKEKTAKSKEKIEMSMAKKLLIFFSIVIVSLCLIIWLLIFIFKGLFPKNERFTLGKVVVVSNGYWNNRSDELSSKVNIKPNIDNIFALKLDDLRKKSLTLPGVEKCDITRIIPDTLEFNIIERVPRAQIAKRPQFVVDSYGVAIPKLKAMKFPSNLPVIYGLPPQVQVSINQEIPELIMALDLIMLTIRDFSDLEITAIDISNKEYYTMFVRFNGGKNKRVIIPATYENMNLRLMALRTAMSQAIVNQQNYTSFDLSFKDRVIMK